MYRQMTLLGLVVGLLLAAAGSAIAQGARDLSSEALKSGMEQSSRLVVVDTRTEQEYRQGHISGAINISSQASNRYSQIAEFLPADKSIPLVLYCRGYS
jgi:phage shock protein E